MTITTDQMREPARTPRLAVFFGRSFRMRTPRHPIAGRTSRYRITALSPGFGR
jgi:hypothetical protein